MINTPIKAKNASNSALFANFLTRSGVFSNFFTRSTSYAKFSNNNSPIKKLILFTVLLAFTHPLFSASYADIGLPVTQVFDSFTHKGTNQNWWLAQAKNGLIYNGTGTGISEWDGEQWSIYNTPQKSRVRSLSLWKDNKIYIGTSNDIGYFYPNDAGSLTYQTLLSDWSFEEKQFGEIWSTAANEHGVMFISNKFLLFWDGKEIKKINAVAGSHRIFGVDDVFYFKNTDETNLYKISINPQLIIEKTSIKFTPNTILRKVIKNKNNKLTFITEKNGIFELSNNELKQRLNTKEFPQDALVYNGIQTKDGYYYLTTLYHGLLIINSDFKLVKHYTDKHGLETNTLLSIIEGQQGNIWISGVPNIIKLVPPHKYSHYLTDSNSKDTEGMALIRGKVTIVGDSIHQFTQSKTKFSPAFFSNVSPERRSTWGAIEYQNHLIYAGTGGVFALKYSENNELSGFEKIVNTRFAKFLAVDKLSNTLFATSEEGLFRIVRRNEKWESIKIPNLTDEIYIMVIDEGVIWTGTSTQELYKIENAQFDDKLTVITKFNDKDGLGPNNVLPYKLSTGLVIGTNDGLMDYDSQRNPPLQFIKTFPPLFHTPGKDIFRLYEDKENNIWYRVGHHTGFMNKDSEGQWQTHEDMFKYFADSGFKGFAKTAKNILWFSLANGNIYRANTDLINNKPEAGILNIRKIINLDTNKEMYGGLGQAHIPILSQQNNSIRIHYALTDNSIVNAVSSNKTQYRHKLIGSGYDKFSPWSQENHKDFTLLRGNDYQFQVQSQDPWGRISTQNLDFSVLPPWYLSQTAWIIYVVLAGLMLLVSSWFTQKWKTKKLKRQNLALEDEVAQRTADVQAQADKLKQQQELKDRFFTNVSHEFRTPLTLTIAPLEAFLQDHPSEQVKFKPVKTALLNAKKMLSLVGQILDINRLESGRFPLHVAQYNISDLINNTSKRFIPWSKQHQQLIQVKNTKEPHLLYCDQDQTEKCLSNLIANAIKYSGNQTTIVISVINKEKQTGISVKDNGKGISPQFENKVFERFTQDSGSEQITEPGTGIGLSFVKELMELHNGNVELQNRPNQGCEFILWFKNGQKHFSSSQLIEPINRNNELTEVNYHALPEIDNKTKKNKDTTTILVVDDNHELREFIASRLSSYYHILEASNGKEGFDICQTQLPDLIISDVMMPLMDGFEMTKKIKKSALTQTIPVILLTAKTTKRETILGLQTGADDYLTKPFDTSELIVRVDGLIKSRKLIRETIKKELSQTITSLDAKSEFSEKIIHQINKNISNPKLSVEYIASTLSMSRHTLVRKCKNECNTTVRDLITQIRMQHALTLLKKSKLSISEIAYGVGYDSLSYFSKVFKKHYNKTPSEIKLQ